MWTIILVLELTRNSKGTIKRIGKKHILPKVPEHTELVRLFNEGTSKEDIIQKYPDIHWVVMDSCIYDITEFVHPGGKYLTHNPKICGRDVSRFLYGGQMLEEYGDEVKGNEHSDKALAILATFKIGDIKEGEDSQKLVVKRKINVDLTS